MTFGGHNTASTLFRDRKESDANDDRRAFFSLVVDELLLH